MRRRLPKDRRPEAIAGALGFVAGAVALSFVIGRDMRDDSNRFTPEIVIGAVLGLVWAASFEIYRRAEGRHDQSRRRKVAGPIALIPPLLWIGFFAWTFGYRGVPGHSRGSIAVATCAFSAVAALYVGLLLVDLAIHAVGAEPERRHQPKDKTEVWHVVTHDVNYFVAQCECEWIGAAIDATDPEAEAKAFAEAHAHGTNVDDAVVEMDL